MDENSLMREKLDGELYKKLQEDSSENVAVIIQTVDGLKDEDRKNMKALGGKIKDDLYIINAFSADISLSAIKKLILSPRIVRIYFDAKVQAV